MKRLALLLAFTLALAGCTAPGANRVSVPVVPAWQAPTGPQTYTSADVLAECQRVAPFVPVDLTDATFTPLHHEWLVAAVDWAWQFGQATGIAYTAESFDCDKFALGFAFAANIAASRAQVHAQPLLGRIFVQQSVTFGNVGAGTGHALNAFLSDRAPYLWVLEPQPSGAKRLVPLAEYPNRATIFRIRIGG